MRFCFSRYGPLYRTSQRQWSEIGASAGSHRTSNGPQSTRPEMSSCKSSVSPDQRQKNSNVLSSIDIARCSGARREPIVCRFFRWGPMRISVASMAITPFQNPSTDHVWTISISKSIVTYLRLGFSFFGFSASGVSRSAATSRKTSPSFWIFDSRGEPARHTRLICRRASG